MQTPTQPTELEHEQAQTIKALKAELLALRKKLRQIHSLCIAPDWSAKRRWRIAELSSP
jgi:hypothetical protein